MFRIKADHPILRRIDTIGDDSDIAELKELGYEVSVLGYEVIDVSNDKMTTYEALKLIKSRLEDFRTLVKGNVKLWNKKYEVLWMKKLQSYIHVESYLYRTSEEYMENLGKIISILSTLDDTDKHEKNCVEFAIFMANRCPPLIMYSTVSPFKKNEKDTFGKNSLKEWKTKLNLTWEVWKEAFSCGYEAKEDNEDPIIMKF